MGITRMAPQHMETIAFSRPGGELRLGPVPSRGRPIDLVHLARQTMGDRALEQEVLSMFGGQIGSVRKSVAAADPDERRRIAHGLKGSARGVGAFALADCADEMEHAPGNRDVVERLCGLIDEVGDFIAAISR